MNSLSRWQEGFRWDSVPLLNYKEEGTHFRGITRQVLFEGHEDLPCQWRYFEIAPGGHSTLERHQHLHVVMVIRGSGQALVGEQILDLKSFDTVRIAALTWHQFRATAGEPFGFLCLVNTVRDKPERPDPAALAKLHADARIGKFIIT